MHYAAFGDRKNVSHLKSQKFMKLVKDTGLVLEYD